MSGETFGQILRSLRIQRGYSQSELSRRASLDASYVHYLERNDGRRRSPSRDVTLALADALDMSCAERDRLLFIAGLAPERDYQSLWQDAEAALQIVRDAVGELTEAVEPINFGLRAG